MVPKASNAAPFPLAILHTRIFYKVASGILPYEGTNGQRPVPTTMTHPVYPHHRWGGPAGDPTSQPSPRRPFQVTLRSKTLAATKSQSCNTMGKHRETTRQRQNLARCQTILRADYPGLVPPSLSIRPATSPIVPSRPGCLCSLCWKPDPSYRIKHDTPLRVSCPFEYSPPVTPSTPTNPSKPPTPMRGLKSPGLNIARRFRGPGRHQPSYYPLDTGPLGQEPPATGPPSLPLMLCSSTRQRDHLPNTQNI